MTALAWLWQWLTGIGGSLATGLIVAVALGLGALAFLFFGSAVVVLERFARNAGRLRFLLPVSLVWAALLGLLGTDVELIEGLGFVWPGALTAWSLSALLALLLLAAAVSLIALLLRHLSARSLVWLGVTAPGLGYALFVGGLGSTGYALAPLLVSGGVWASFVWRRRATGAGQEGARSVGESLSALLSLLLGAGLLFALLHGEPSVAVARSGGLLLGGFLLLVLLGLLPLAATGLVESRGSAEWFIAWRYLFARRRQTFISVITGICVAGVAAGVWLIVTVLSVMNGFERTWREEIIGNRAHLTVQSAHGSIEGYAALLERIDAFPEVEGASPYTEMDGMVRGERGEILGVRLRGVDPGRVTGVTDLREDLLPGSEGALEALAPDAQGDPGVVIGHRLAQAIGVGPGDPFTLISPFGGPPTPLGPAPRLVRFRVAGVFQSSFFQYDEIYAYTDLAGARSFQRSVDAVSGIEVRTGDYYRSRRVARALERELGFPYYTRDWKEFFPPFFQALKTERIMMFVLLTMIMVVAAFTIVVTLIMMIMEKSSDIAILKAMGATDAMVERIFALQGTMIGLLGTTLGLVSGVAVTTQLDWIQKQIEFLTGVDTLPAEIYQFSNLPWEIQVGQLAVVSAIAMVLALGATLLPSRHGARLDPAPALRSE